jgi:hypothetical protein
MKNLARNRTRRLVRILGLLPAVLTAASCSEPTAPSSAPSDDAALFRTISETDPFGAYTAFPNAEEFTEGRLNGSEAHRPIVRTRLNARALGALQNGRLPAGSQFPAGSIIFKEIRPRADAAVTAYAVMYKDSGNPVAGNGWVWAEFSPNGSVQYSTSNRGSGCTSCHLREEGPRNDLVRTFERQR